MCLCYRHRILKTNPKAISSSCDKFSFSNYLQNGEKTFIMEHKACLWNRTHPEWPLCVNVVYLPLAILWESSQLQHPLFGCGFNDGSNRRWHCYSWCWLFFRQGYQLLALFKVSILSKYREVFVINESILGMENAKAGIWLVPSVL